MFYPLAVAESGHFSPRAAHLWNRKAGLVAGGLEALVLVVLVIWAQGQKWPFHDITAWKVVVLQALAVLLVFFGARLMTRLRNPSPPAPTVMELDESDLVASPSPPPLPTAREMAEKLARPDVKAFLQPKNPRTH